MYALMYFAVGLVLLGWSREAVEGDPVGTCMLIFLWPVVLCIAVGVALKRLVS